jgi:hypothetical protein
MERREERETEKGRGAGEQIVREMSTRQSRRSRSVIRAFHNSREQLCCGAMNARSTRCNGTLEFYCCATMPKQEYHPSTPVPSTNS